MLAIQDISNKLSFDLESGVRVTCDVGYLCANSSLPRPLCSRVRPDVRVQLSDRETDRRQTKALLPPYGGGGIIIIIIIMSATSFLYILGWRILHMSGRTDSLSFCFNSFQSPHSALTWCFCVTAFFCRPTTRIRVCSIL